MSDLNVLFISRRNVHAAYYRSLIDQLDLSSKIHTMGKPSLPSVKCFSEAFSKNLDDIVDSQYKRKVARSPKFWKLSGIGYAYKKILGLTEKLRLAKYLNLLNKENPNIVILWNGNKLPNQTVALAAKMSQVKLYFYENGLLPNTTSLDPQGVNEASSVSRDPGFYFNEKIETLPIFEPPELIAREQHKKRQKGNVIDLPERYIFVPFQVPHDTQVVCFSPWIDSMESLYDEVMLAVNQLGDPTLKIIFKEHPSWHKHFDGLYQKDMNAIFANHNDTEQLISGAEAVITINSTVGLEALQLGKKVITLGEACYNIEGLVLACKNRSELADHLTQLDHWQPDLNLRNNYFRYLQYVYCVDGSWKKCTSEHVLAVNKRLTQGDLFSFFSQDKSAK